MDTQIKLLLGALSEVRRPAPDNILTFLNALSEAGRGGNFGVDRRWGTQS